jgi:hypothetical protein
MGKPRISAAPSVGAPARRLPHQPGGRKPPNQGKDSRARPGVETAQVEGTVGSFCAWPAKLRSKEGEISRGEIVPNTIPAVCSVFAVAALSV